MDELVVHDGAFSRAATAPAEPEPLCLLVSNAFLAGEVVAGPPLRLALDVVGRGTVAVSAAPVRPLWLRGRASWQADTGALQAQMQLGIAQTRISLSTRASSHTFTVDELGLTVANLDLRTFLPRAPPSELSLRAHLTAKGRTLAELSGHATVEVERGTLGGHPVGPLHLDLGARQGTVRLTELTASLPGARITARGAVYPGLGLEATASAPDLAPLLAAWAGPTHKGRGAAHFALSLSGALAHPELSLVGQLHQLTWGKLTIPSARLSVRVRDLSHGLAAEHLSLSVPAAGLGTRHLSGLMLTVQSSAAQLSSHLSLGGPEPLAAWARGTWQPARGRLVVSQLAARWPGVVWALRRPAVLLFDGSRLRLTGFDLHAAPDQSVSARLALREDTLHLYLRARHLALASLPLALVPGHGWAGQLDLRAELHQSHHSRTAVAHLAVHRAKVDAISGLELTADAHLTRGRVTGNLDLTLPGSQAHAGFDLPGSWPPPPRARLGATAALSTVDLTTLLPSVGIAAVGGRAASVHLVLAGTAGKPRLNASLRASQAAWHGQDVGDLTLDLAVSDQPATLRIRLEDDHTPGGSGGLALALSTQRPTRLLMAHPTWPALAELPFTLEVKASQLDLGRMAALCSYRGSTTGQLAFSGRLEGTLHSPRGQFDGRLTSLAGKGLPSTDVELHLLATPHDLTAHARAMRKGVPLLSARATVQGPLSRVLSTTQLPDASIALHATLGPILWQHAGIVTDLGKPRLLRGVLTADLDLAGSPRQPQLELVAKTPDVRLDGRPVGAAVLTVRYVREKLASNLDLAASDGGRLLLTSSLTADLGYPALRHLPPLRALPVDLDLRASALDLSVLSGALPFVRTLAGRLQADVHLTGRLGDPRPSGRLEWQAGQVLVVGMGAYQHIHLLLHGDRDHLAIDELRADSGPGHARLTASADYQPEHGYAIRAAVKLDKIPAYLQGQELAQLSLGATARSQTGPRPWHSQVEITAARVELSDVKRKHLEPLGRPSDVIIVASGQPIGRAQARQLAATDRALAHPPPAASPAALAAGPPLTILRVSAPRNLWLSGKDANIEVGLLPGFRVEVDDRPRLFGELTIKRGYFVVLGRRFDLKNTSSLTFSGSPETPDLDLTAQYVTADQTITVLATVKGTPGHLKTTLTAPDHPELTESQLYTVVVAGKLTLGGGSTTPSSAPAQAESALGGLLAGQLQTLIAKKVPFDVFTVQAGATAEEARVEAGKYVTPDLYLGYVGNLGADPTLLQNRNAVRLEYDVGSRWSFQGEYGDAKTGSLDLFWTKRY
ncbi:MAG: translocation/assembly module TamB domain-containing protein [Polyangia bacterium]